MALTARKFRNYNDFKYGSFTVYVTKHECMIRGILKKTNSFSPFILIVEK
jgi:hypothetical protein